MLGVEGYPYKRNLKAAKGQPLSYVETSAFGAEYHGDGVYTVVGPDAYNRRDWYATVTIKEGVIHRVD